MDGYVRVFRTSVGNATLKFTCYPQRDFFNAAFNNEPRDSSAPAASQLTLASERVYVFKLLGLTRARVRV